MATDKLILPLGEIPAVIRESVRAVLNAHGVVVVPMSARATIGNERPGEALNERHLSILLDECGRNAAQSLYSIHLPDEDDVAIEPDLAAIRAGER